MCIAEPPALRELREPPDPGVLLPADPGAGPPFPRGLKIRWPWQAAPACRGWPAWDRGDEERQSDYTLAIPKVRTYSAKSRKRG